LNIEKGPELLSGFLNPHFECFSHLFSTLYTLHSALKVRDAHALMTSYTPGRSLHIPAWSRPYPTRKPWGMVNPR